MFGMIDWCGCTLSVLFYFSSKCLHCHWSRFVKIIWQKVTLTIGIKVSVNLLFLCCTIAGCAPWWHSLKRQFSKYQSSLTQKEINTVGLKGLFRCGSRISVRGWSRVTWPFNVHCANCCVHMYKLLGTHSFQKDPNSISDWLDQFWLMMSIVEDTDQFLRLKRSIVVAIVKMKT